MIATLCVFLAGFVFSVAGQNNGDWERWLSPSEFNLFPTLPIAAPLSKDARCREDSRKLILNLRNRTLWATQMWDSSATAAFGVLHGNKYHLGNYDECLVVTKPIRAQYCQVKIRATVHQKEAFQGDFYELDPEPNVTVWKKIQGRSVNEDNCDGQLRFFLVDANPSAGSSLEAKVLICSFQPNLPSPGVFSSSNFFTRRNSQYKREVTFSILFLTIITQILIILP